MRHKLFALILAMTFASWAQTAKPETPAPASPNAKPTCCDKTANSKDGHAACMRSNHQNSAKNAVSCCSGKADSSCCGKDGKSCMKGDATAASCCKDGCDKDKKASCCDKKAGKECGKDCCGSNKAEKTA